MSKKFEDIVNKPHRAFGRARGKLIHDKWPKAGKKRALRVGKITFYTLMQFITWTMKYAVLDNHLTRKLEELFAKLKSTDSEGKKKLWRSFIRKNPNFISHIVYYMMIVATAAGVDLSKDDSAIKETIKEWIADLTGDDEKKTTDILVIDTKSTVKNINNTVPHLNAVSTNQSQSQFVNQAVQEYWNEIAVVLTELETYRATPKLHSGESRYTNGFGCTWQYWYNDAGKLIRSANYKSNTKALSKSQNMEQLRRHLIYETLPALYNAIKPYDNITPQMQIALIMAGYQRPADMKHIAKKLASAKTVQQVADAFADVSNVPSKWREGTHIRRYTCALYAIGAISAEQMLDWTRDSFSMININTIYRNGHFVITKENIEYLLGRSRGGNNTVREFLSDFDAGRQVVAQIKTPKEKFKFDEKAEDSNYEKSMALVSKADKKFQKEKYVDAEKLYIQALELNPDNMEAYSSLALTYKMLGDKNKSEEYYQKCIDKVVECNERMNSNKSMLSDRRVKAMTYYNAGLARQEMGRMAQEAGNISKAKEQYQLAQKNFRTAKENAGMIGLDSDVIDIYDQAINDVKKMMDTIKKLSFKSSAAKIKNKSIVLERARAQVEEYQA